MADWVDFNAVKAAVTMEMVLTHYQIKLGKTNATYLRGKCPLPMHTGDSENSLGVNTQKNAWACHVTSCVAGRDGKKGGNVLDFVAVMEGCSIRDAALKLQNWFNVEANNERPKDYVPSRDRPKGNSQLVAKKKDEPTVATLSDEKSDDEAVNPPLEFELKSIDSSHPYFKRRGVKEETAKHFGAGFFHGRGSMHGRVVFPVHNEIGELIGYAGRAVDDEMAEKEGKYKTPFHKSLVLFNLHRVLETKSREIIVGEGFFGTMKIFQAGFPNVVAVMGSSLSDEQEQLLVENFDRVVIIGDGDDSGRAFARDASERLTRKMFVRVVDLPDNVQPDKLSSEQIQKLLAFM